MQTLTDPRTSLDYLRRREQQERDLAARTNDAMIQRIHLDLAERYAAMTGVHHVMAA